MARLKLKRTAAQLAKMYENPATPAGFLPAEWQALRDAHARGVVAYTIPGRNANAVWSMNERMEWVAVGELGSAPKATIAHAPAAPARLNLAPGCLRCGEPLDKAARDDTCSACLLELAAKARLEAMEARDHRPRVDVPYLHVVEVAP